jgi:hypothetical protein
VTQPIPKESLDYERFVDGLRLQIQTMQRLAAAREKQFAAARKECDSLRGSNAAMREALHQAREYISGEVDVVDGHYGAPDPNAAMQLAQEIDAAVALAEQTGTKAQSKTITVHLEGGLVQDVTGIPAGYEVHVHDHDEGDTSHPSWDEEKRCFVTVYGGDGA